MSNVDERIVKMKFDNKQFEDGVSESISTLSRLEESLKLDGIRDSIDTVSDKLSGLGVVGATIINNLTTSLINTGKDFISSIMDPILEGGKKRALNMEHALFMFKGLGIDEKIALDNANVAVTGTAYSLDAAAKAAAMLAASGQKLGDPMTQSLRAIAGVAAMANAPFEDMAHIFTTVASNGKLMTQQIRQFSFRGLNMAAVLGKELGVSESKVMEMTTAGKISWEKFYKAIYNQYGDFAAKANETFEGASSNLRAAWARVGEPFFTTLHNSKRDIANAFRPVVNQFNKGLEPVRRLFKEWMGDRTSRKVKFLENLDLSNLKVFIQILTNLGRVIFEVKKAFQNAWNKVFPPKTEKSASKFLTTIRTFTLALIPSREQAYKLEKVFRGVLSVFGLVGDVIKTVFTVVKILLMPVIEIFGLFGKITTKTGGGVLSLIAGIGDLLYRFREWIEENKILTFFTDKLEVVMRFLIDTVKALFRFIGNLQPIRKLREAIQLIIPTMRQWFYDFKNSAFVKNFLDFIKDAGPRTRAWFENFRNSEFVKTAASNVRTFAEKTKDWLGNLKDTSTYQKASSGIKTVTDRIKEWFQQVRSGEAFQNFKDKASSAFTTVKTKISDFLKSPQFQSFTAKTKEIFGHTLDWIKDKYSVTKDAIVKFFQDIRDETGKIDFNKVKDAVATFFKNLLVKIKEYKKNVKDTIFGTFSSMKDGFDKAAANAGTIGEKLMGIVKGLFDYLKHLDINDITKLIGSIVGLKAVSALKDVLLKPLSKIGINISGIFKNIGEGIKDFSKGMEKNLKAKALNEQATALLKFAAAIAVMAASLWIISQIPQDDLLRAGITLGIVTGVLVGVFVLMSVMKTKIAEASKGMPASKSIFAGISPIVQVVGALTAAIAALKSLTSLNTEGLIPKVLLLLGVVAAFVLLARFLGGRKSNVKMSSVKGLPDGILESFSSEEIGQSVGQVAELLVLAQAVKMLVSAIQAMTKVDIKGSEGKIIAMMTLIGTLLAMTRLAGKNAKEGGIALIAIAASMWLFAAVFKKIGAIPEAEINRALTTLALLMVGISVFLLATRAAGENSDKAAKSMVALSIAIGIITISIVALSKLSPEQLIPALLAVDSLLLIMGIIITISNKADGAQKNIYAITAMAVVLTGAIVALSFIDPEKLLPAALALDMTLGMVALLIKVADDAKTAEGTLAVMLIFVAGVAGIIWGLSEINNVDKAIAIAAGLSEVLLAASAAAFVASKIDLAAAGKGALAIDAVIVLVGGLFTLLALIDEWVGKDFDLMGKLERGIEIAVAISNGIGQIFGAFIGGIAEGVFASLPKIGDSLNEFMDKMKIFANSVTSLPNNLAAKVADVAGAVVIMMGVELLDAAKGYLSFFMGGGRSLADIANDLVLFAPKIVEFSEKIKSINGYQMNAAAETMKGFGILLAALPREGGILESLFGKQETLDSFSNGITSFGNAIMSFQKVITDGGGIKKQVVDDAANAGKSLAELEASLPSHGGKLREWFLGDSDLESFGNSLNKFAIGLVTMQMTLKSRGGIDSELVTAAADAGKSLSELESSLPSHGGKLKEWFLGDADLESFGKSLNHFAVGITTFQTTIKSRGGINPELIESAASAGKSLAELESSLPKHGGILKDWFSGDASLETFGNELNKFAIGLVTMQMTLKSRGGVDEKLVAMATNAGLMLAGMESALPPHDGIVQAWTGQQSLSSFGKEMVAYGESLADFYEVAKPINERGLFGALTTTKKVIEIANSLEGSRGGLKSIWSHEYNFTDLGTELVALGSGLKSFSDNVGADFNTSVFTDVVPTLKELVAAAQGMGQIPQSAMTLFSADLKRVGEGGVTGFTDAFTGKPEKIKAAISSLMTNAVSEARAKESELKGAFYQVMNNSTARLIDAINEFKNGWSYKNAFTTLITDIKKFFTDEDKFFTSQGTTYMTNMISAVRTQAYYVKTNIVLPVKDALTELGKMKDDFKKTGIDLAQGFIDGITSKNRNVKTAGENLGKTALKGTKDSIESRSPSKAFYRLGAFGVDGLVNALAAGQSRSEDAGYDLAHSSMIGLKEAMALVYALLEDEMESPVIKPIVDMDDIYLGLSTINSLLGGRTYTNNLAYKTSGTMASVKTQPIAQQLELLLGKMSPATSTTYDIDVKVEGDGLSADKIREIAVGVEREIKAMDDRRRFSRGEAVSFG